MKIGVLFLLAAALVTMAGAETITVTITGKVASGGDATNVFGLGTGANLSGYPFKLILTFDDTQGAEAAFGCPSCYESENTGSGATNFGTATLTIDNIKPGFTFGVYPGNTPLSLAFSSTQNTGEVQYSVQDGGSLGFSLLSVRIYGDSTASTLGNSFDWRASFSATGLTNPSNSLSFEIEEDRGAESAGGSLTASKITVSGPACPDPISETIAWSAPNPGWDPTNGTVGIWNQTLTALNGDPNYYAGWTVRETNPYKGLDECYFKDSMIEEMIDFKATRMPTTAILTQQQTWQDAVVWSGVNDPPLVDAVDYYRAQSIKNHIPTLPCTFSMPQQMEILCPATRKYQTYGHVNILQGTIGASTVSSSKAGTTETETWTQ
jgi:hypothetical protein